MDDFRPHNLVLDPKCELLSSRREVSLQRDGTDFAAISPSTSECGGYRFFTDSCILSFGVRKKHGNAGVILSLGCEE